MDILAVLNSSMSHPSFIAFIASFLWGALSVIISPCHLGSLPLIIAYINNREKPETKTAFSLSLFFCIGLLIMLALIGIITSITGRILGDTGDGILIFVAVFLIICGIWLMDIIPFFKISSSFTPRIIKPGKQGSLILGLFYGLALGPCSFAFMAPMLGFVFSASISNIAFGIFLMIFYAVGHTSVIIAAGTFGDVVNKLLQKEWTGKLLPLFKKICGAGVIAVGIHQLVNIL